MDIAIYICEQPLANMKLTGELWKKKTGIKKYAHPDTRCQHLLTQQNANVRVYVCRRTSQVRFNCRRLYY